MGVILYLGPVAIASWLLIGGVAYSSEKVYNSDGAGFIVGICCVFYVMALIFTLMFDEGGNHSHGPAFASGMIGCGLGGFRSLVVAETLGYRFLFWALGGMLAGWVVEWTLHPVAWLIARREKK